MGINNVYYYSSLTNKKTVSQGKHSIRDISQQVAKQNFISTAACLQSFIFLTIMLLPLNHPWNLGPRRPESNPDRKTPETQVYWSLKGSRVCRLRLPTASNARLSAFQVQVQNTLLQAASCCLSCIERVRYQRE